MCFNETVCLAADFLLCLISKGVLVLDNGGKNGADSVGREKKRAGRIAGEIECGNIAVLRERKKERKKE